MLAALRLEMGSRALALAFLSLAACSSGGESGAGGAAAGSSSSTDAGAGGATATTGAGGEATTSAATTGGATTSSATTGATTSGATTGAGGGPAMDVQQLCVDTINGYRKTLNLPPFTRWSAVETCADDQATKDAAINKPHGAFGQCGEMSQNECPGVPGATFEIMIGLCLQKMWDEGPGPSNQGHSHYNHMSSTTLTTVACGFYKPPNGLAWSTQDFK